VTPCSVRRTGQLLDTMGVGVLGRVRIVTVGGRGSGGDARAVDTG